MSHSYPLHELSHDSHVIVTHEESATYKVSTKFLGKHQDPSRGVWLLQLVVDRDEGLQVGSGGSAMEVLFFVVEGLGIGPAGHGTLSEELRGEGETALGGGGGGGG